MEKEVKGLKTIESPVFVIFDSDIEATAVFILPLISSLGVEEGTLRLFCICWDDGYGSI